MNLIWANMGKKMKGDEKSEQVQLECERLMCCSQAVDSLLGFHEENMKKKKKKKFYQVKIVKGKTIKKQTNKQPPPPQPKPNPAPL